MSKNSKVLIPLVIFVIALFFVGAMLKQNNDSPDEPTREVIGGISNAFIGAAVLILLILIIIFLYWVVNKVKR